MFRATLAPIKGQIFARSFSTVYCIGRGGVLSLCEFLNLFDLFRFEAELIERFPIFFWKQAESLGGDGCIENIKMFEVGFDHSGPQSIVFGTSLNHLVASI